MSNCFVILAIILAPIIAIQVQKYFERRKEEKDRKMNVFRTLMTTRANPLHQKHVEALNMIDIEFYDDEKVIKAWKSLLDNFGHYPTDSKDPSFQSKLDTAVDKSKTLLTKLLFIMAESLNYSFDEVHLKRGVYIPRGHIDLIRDQELIRRSLLGIFSGNLPIPVKIIDMRKGKQPDKTLQNK